jgi:hypothetical protein
MKLPRLLRVIFPKLYDFRFFDLKALKIIGKVPMTNIRLETDPDNNWISRISIPNILSHLSQQSRPSKKHSLTLMVYT